MPKAITPPDIRFRVGPWIYTVVTVDELSSRAGKPLIGRADNNTHTIFVRSDVAPRARLSVVLHELRHAWSYHFPPPKDEEEEADFYASITAALLDDYRTQREAMDVWTGSGKEVANARPSAPRM